MSTASQIGFGIALAHSTTLGGTYTTMAEILDIKPATESVDEVKVYRSDNAAATVERIPGWTEHGDLECTVTYTAAMHTVITSLRGIAGFWKVTYPKQTGQVTTGDTETFAGFIKEFGKETPLKDAMKAKIKLAVNGDITFVAGA